MSSDGHRSSRQLPNETLLKTLYDSYYQTEKAQEEASSHGQKYGKECTVELNASGVPAVVHGEGFGDLQVRTLASPILSKLTIIGHLALLKNRVDLIRVMGAARRLSTRMGLEFTQDAFRQLCTLCLIQAQLRADGRVPRRVLLIGDGYGFLGSLIRATYPNIHVVFVDLGKTLLFQSLDCQRAYPDAIHSGVQESIASEITPDFVYCPAEEVESLGGEFNVAVNIASMQEMTRQSVESYFDFMRRRGVKLFYCANRERKVLVGGETRVFMEYPWMSADVHLVDEPCPWHQWYVASSAHAGGPRWRGVRVPLINYFDGIHVHRLTRLELRSVGSVGAAEE
jgi:hypothetical protein